MSRALAVPIRSLSLISAKNGNLIREKRKTAILSDSTGRAWLRENASPETLMCARPVWEILPLSLSGS